CSDASKLEIGLMPLLPSTHASQKASLPMPFGATTPKPVMTTLRMVFHLPPAGRANTISVPISRRNQDVPLGGIPPLWILKRGFPRKAKTGGIDLCPTGLPPLVANGNKFPPPQRDRGVKTIRSRPNRACSNRKLPHLSG